MRRSYLAGRLERSRADQQPVVVAVQHRARRQRRAAERHRNVDLAEPLLCALERIRPQCLDADLQLGKRNAVTNRAVDHEPGPTVGHGERADHVADQRDAQRRAAVDDQHRTFARRRHRRPHERVVFEGAHRADPSVERAPSAELSKLHVAALDLVRVRIDEVGGDEPRHRRYSQRTRGAST
jgi:hypothetical protein